MNSRLSNTEHRCQFSQREGYRQRWEEIAAKVGREQPGLGARGASLGL